MLVTLAWSLLAPNVLMAAQGSPGNAPPPIPFPLEARSVAELRQGLDLLKQTIWRIQDSPEAKVPDAKGRTFAGDMSAYVLGPKAAAGIEDALSAASETFEKNPQADVQATLKRPVELLMGEFMRAMLLSQFWSSGQGPPAHMAYIDALLAKADDAQREATRAQLTADTAPHFEQMRDLAIRPDAPAPGDAMQLATSQNKVFDVYNKVRGDLAEKLSQAANARGERGVSQTRITECPPPETARAPDANVSLKKGADISKFYPPELLRISVAGTVRVRLTVTNTGCVAAAEVWGSSGVPELDAAGLRVAFEMQLYPASVGGKAVESNPVLPVRFSLRDAPIPPSQ